LCGLCAERDPRLKEWAAAESLRIVACYPRAIKWLFAAGGAPLAEEGVEFINMRTGKAEDMVASLGDGPAAGASGGQIRPEKDGDWIPWFPVIDYDLCEGCRKCLDFCLFGVYELGDDERVEVRNPANCKTNCPACARTCPNSAIIFPKYPKPPVNGDEVPEPASESEKKADLAEVLGGDIYDAIRKRGKGKRFSAEKTPDSPSTIKELKDKLDIPPDVLAALSPADLTRIRNKADKKGRESESHE